MKKEQMEKKVLKTITIGRDDNPNNSLCPGHVDAETFNKAFLAEGWSDAEFTQDDLSYEYWTAKKGKWSRSVPGKANVLPVTVISW